MARTPSRKIARNAEPLPAATLEELLRVSWDAVFQAVLILPQIKLNSQLSHCALILADNNMASPGGSDDKELPAIQETQLQSLGQEDPLEKEWDQPPVFLPGEIRGQKSLMGCSPWGPKELNTTKWLTHTLRNIYIYLVFISVSGTEFLNPWNFL